MLSLLLCVNGGNMAGKDATLSRYTGLMLATSGIQQVFSSSTVAIKHFLNSRTASE